MKLLDLFCGAGGAAMGYYRAGFTDITGIDIKPMKRYPFKFIQADALEYLEEHGREYDVIHASPPCQVYSITKNLKTITKTYPDLIDKIRIVLLEIGRPYVIENVVGAPLLNPLMLCGSMFGLGVIRHRLFESAPPIWFSPASCRHGRVLPMWWATRKKFLEQGRQHQFICVAGDSFLVSEGRKAMGIDWMTRKELAQAIPPAYTEFIGRQLEKRK